jgi:hypothetical protein
VTLTLAKTIAGAARASGRLRVRAFVVTDDAAQNTDTTTRSATLRVRR